MGGTAKMAAFGAGMAAEYLLDPQQGRRRRHMLRDRTMARLRAGSREAEKRARYAAGQAQGMAAEATPPGRDSSELNDAGLEAKVESELFQPADAPKGSLNVSVEEGVVYLRGHLEDRERSDRLTEEAKAIDGVLRVVNLIQLPGETGSERG